MVVANTTRGLTLSFDLAEPDSRTALLQLLASGQVTALSLLREGVQHTLTTPRGFRGTPAFGAEPLINGGRGIVGERIFVQAGEVRVMLSLTFTGNVVRTDLVRTGTMKYNAQDKRRAP